MFKNFFAYIDSIMARDPAARSRIEVFLLYPGLHAVLWHRLAHRLWVARWYFAARAVSQLSRLTTNIEIHPGATIGENLFIDHGTGVVIGETAIIGDNVTLYHDVTLGGTSLQHSVRRHPVLGDNVIVGAGAQILGPINIAGGARVGANAVVLADVAAGVTVVGIPARPMENRNGIFMAYGTPENSCEDDELAKLRMDIDQLAERVAQLENGDSVEARLSGS